MSEEVRINFDTWMAKSVNGYVVKVNLSLLFLWYHKIKQTLDENKLFFEAYSVTIFSTAIS